MKRLLLPLILAAATLPMLAACSHEHRDYGRAEYNDSNGDYYRTTRAYDRDHRDFNRDHDRVNRDDRDHNRFFSRDSD